ncbi:hypothetical protein BBJ28_00000681 [Nothophytophthora sp. Chile5]|nr:hypothetical protein BBJ28_00000681 [Nothophytophthora sp. Chile5]
MLQTSDPFPLYDLEGGKGVPVKAYRPSKGHQSDVIRRLRDNKAVRVSERARLALGGVGFVIMWIAPLSLFSVMAKMLTYWSYNAVPVSITHTCKASQPFFNVVLAYLIYRSRFSLATYSSLLPIVFGVVMASVSEMGMNVRSLFEIEAESDLAFSGTMFAVTSALLGVMQSMYAKFLLRRRIVSDSVNLHFYGAFVSFAINAPYVLMNSRAHQDNFVASFPFGKVLLCSMLHFVGSFCSSWVLGEVSELTFSIMSTMKRVVIILSAVFYFGNPVTAQSMLGMALAVR